MTDMTKISNHIFIPCKSISGAPSIGSKGIVLRSNSAFGTDASGNDVHRAFVAIRPAIVPLPMEGLVFHAPLAENKTTAETGQTLTKHGSVTFQTFKGIPCGFFNSAGVSAYPYYSGSCITFPDTGLPSASLSRTVSLWVNSTSINTNGTCFAYGTRDSTGNYISIFMNETAEDGVFIRYNHWGGGGCNASVDLNSWYHVCYTENNLCLTCYIDGILISSTTEITLNTILKLGVIGAGSWYWNGYIAGVRVYNRVLSSAEIEALAHEYTPQE